MAQFHNAEMTDLHPLPSPKMGAKACISARGDRRAGRAAPRIFAAGELRLILLHYIHQGACHGYGLIKAIADMTGGAYSPSPGAVYPTLTLMLEEAVIKERASGDEGFDDEEKEGKRRFIASKEGAAELDVRREELNAVLTRLAALADLQASERSPPIAAAMERLERALEGRAECGGLEAENAREIAVWIDDLSGRIMPP